MGTLLHIGDGAAYSERRALLEALEVEGPRVGLVAMFEDGEALFAAVCERGP